MAALLSLVSPVRQRPASAAATPGQPRPNVLLLLTDQQTMRAMSAAGNPYLYTPHMDALAAAGVRFTNSYCTSPVCGPSRSSIITGRMPHETGVELNGQTPNPDIPNLGHIFRRAGYLTAWAGKWHLPASYPRPPDGTVPGFHYLHMPPGTRFTLGAQTDEAVADAAIAFLRRQHDQPWLLSVSLHNPHDICWTVRQELPPPPHLERFPPLPNNFAICPDEPEFLTDCRKPKTYGVEQQYTANWDETRWRIYLHNYYRLTEQVDRAVERILRALRQTGLEKNTLILFTSDHGEGCAGHRLVVKLWLYEEAATVPFMISYPGVIPAGRTDQTHLVSGIDIVPTLCDYAGLPSPPHTTGVSLRPVIEDPQTQGHEYVVTELSPFKEQPHRRGRMLRTLRFKYLAFTDGHNPEMLFDLKTDPGEMHNLARNPAWQEQLTRHRHLLHGWITQTADTFRIPHK